jgi:hypothetical protein
MHIATFVGALFSFGNFGNFEVPVVGIYHGNLIWEFIVEIYCG